jgi:plasmid stabilization system protein ParE
VSVEVVLTEVAREEIREARRWYSRIDPGLGRDFARSVRASLDRISDFPESHPVVVRGVRKALVRRFPYLILYRIQGRRALVVACFHAHRNRLS